jgi:hypothetical protein
VGFFFREALLTVNTCVNSLEFSVKRQITGHKLVIRIKINKVRSYSFLKVCGELVVQVYSQVALINLSFAGQVKKGDLELSE